MLVAMEDVIATRTVVFRRPQILLVGSRDHHQTTWRQQVSDSVEEWAKVAFIKMFDHLYRNDAREALAGTANLRNQECPLKSWNALIPLIGDSN